MKTLIVSYSLTGNNRALARSCAGLLGADHFELEEERERRTGAIVLDMVTGRKPRLKALPPTSSHDLVVFMGPVWMFHVPSPFRACFAAMKAGLGKYAYVSLSGGALGANVSLARDLGRRLGRKNQALVLDINAVHFCAGAGQALQPGHGGSETEAYRLEEHPEDLERISRMVCGAIGALRR